MSRRHLLICLLIAWPAAADRRDRASKKQCAELTRRMRQIESQLRDGHTARQGRQLRRRMRELQLQRFRGCR